MIRLALVTTQVIFSALAAFTLATIAAASPFQGPGTPFCTPTPAAGPLCPCGIFGAPGHGCDNSIHTGGALLTGTGTTTPDTIHLVQILELPTGLSIFLQGDVPVSPPAVFGDGIRCTGGHLLRLYTHSAVGGMVSAPSGGDPPITVESALHGMPIPPGAPRFYQVYYRDPGFICPPALEAHFNVGNGWMIVWL